MNQMRDGLGNHGVIWILGICSLIFLAGLLLLLVSIPGLLVAALFVLGIMAVAGWLRGRETRDAHDAHRADEPVLVLDDFMGIRTNGRPKPGWLSQAILSGFIASMAMLLVFGVAYATAVVLGSGAAGPADTASRMMMARWFYNLAHNPVTDLAKTSLYFTIGGHIFLGVFFAAIYAYFVEPRMWGPHWARGAVFSLLPFLVSVLVFLPAVGGGLFGYALGAGPLPFIGNMLLNAVYGIVLGVVYGPFGDYLPTVEETKTREHYLAMVASEAAAAKGIVTGTLLGLVLGALSGQYLPSLIHTLAMQGPAALTILGLALIGGAVGALVGSFFGLPRAMPPSPTQ